MAAPVISDHRPRRKRGSVWGWFSRRFGALAVTLLALGSVSWISPLLGGAPPRPARHASALPPTLPAKTADLFKPMQNLADAQMSVIETPRHHRRSISLNVGRLPRGDRFEILNAAELDAISQAH